jgi:mannosyl-3-phosphoglycerate phosphatase
VRDRPTDSRPDLWVITDLDGTLLDASTYSAAAAEPVVDRLRRSGIPIVPCSSKTRAEIESLMARLAIAGPFIAENGGAVFLPATPDDGDDFSRQGKNRLRRVPLGRPYADVVALIRSAAADVGVPTRGFADMSVAEVAADCGLSPLDAQLAKLREFDEPFRMLSENAAACGRLLRALHRSGLSVLQGGRYHHAVGGTDKGAAIAAFRRLVARNTPAVLVGLGDAPNDVGLLRAVDVPVVVRRSDPRLTQWLSDRVPSAQVTREPGPAGWATAVSRIVDAWEAGDLWPGAAGIGR